MGQTIKAMLTYGVYLGSNDEGWLYGLDETDFMDSDEPEEWLQKRLLKASGFDEPSPVHPGASSPDAEAFRERYVEWLGRRKAAMRNLSVEASGYLASGGLGLTLCRRVVTCYAGEVEDAPSLGHDWAMADDIAWGCRALGIQNVLPEWQLSCYVG